MDFKLNITHDGDIRILQITDMQIIDANQRRFPDRIKGWSVTAWVPENNEKNLYSHRGKACRKLKDYFREETR